MLPFVRIVCLSALIFLLSSIPNIWAISLSDKLAMLGYSDGEIKEVVSGRTSLNTLEIRYQREMMGYDNSPPSPIKSVLFLYANPENRKVYLWEEAGKPYFDIIRDAARKSRLKESLLMAVIKVESNFKANALSPKGAIGLMQLMPGTARDLGLANPFDPSENIHGGAKYLSDCIDKFRSLELGLAAYNAGPNLVAKLKRIPSIEETQDYVKNVMKYIKIYEPMSRRN